MDRWLILWLVATTLSAPDDVVYRYVDAVLRDDLAAANELWWPADLDRATALGVSTLGRPLRADLDSPLWRHRADLAKDRVALSVAPVETSRSRGLVSLRIGEESHRAYLRQRGDRWWLCTALTALTSPWDRLDGKWVQVALSPHRQISEEQLTALDSEVGRLLDVLDVAPARRETLRQAKLRYVLATDAEVEALVGTPTQGVALLGEHAVVTQRAFHPHELVHLVVDVALTTTQPYTLPLLREGIAVHLGGRLGMAPETVPYMARLQLEAELATLNQVLTVEDFRALPPDVSYPLAAVVVEALHARLGWSGVLGLSQELSGEFAVVAEWDRGAIEAKLEEFTGEAWPTWRRRAIDVVLQAERE